MPNTLGRRGPLRTVSLVMLREDTGDGAVLSASRAYLYPQRRWYVVAGMLTFLLIVIGLVWAPPMAVGTALGPIVGALIAPVFVKYAMAPLSLRVTACGGQMRVEHWFGTRSLSGQVLVVSPGARFELTPRRRLLGMDIRGGDSIVYGGASVAIPLMFRRDASDLRDALNRTLAEFEPQPVSA